LFCGAVLCSILRWIGSSELKAQEEAHQRELEKRKKLAEEQLKRKSEEDFKRQELEQRALEETERKAEAERRAKEEELKLHRPWNCNIPLLRLIDGRCRAYSKPNPTHNNTDLFQFFIEASELRDYAATHDASQLQFD
jgi:hypothetical protein